MTSHNLVYLVHVRPVHDLPRKDNDSLRRALERELDTEPVKTMLGKKGKATHVKGCYSASFWLHGAEQPQSLVDHLHHELNNGALQRTPFYGKPVAVTLHPLNPESLATMDAHQSRRRY